jgi:Pyridoxamine 5'-phosphate oxidase
VQERTVICATLGPRGWPHLMPLWYVLRAAPPEPGSHTDVPPADEGSLRLWAWTYAASQKVRNLERDSRATLLVETGESYEQLRGVTLECEVAIHRDIETVAALGREIFRRYAAPRGRPPASELHSDVAAMVRRQAAKRVGLEFIERRRATWDHAKLGGAY